MQIERKTGYAPKVETIAAAAALVKGPCIGCPGCRGMCDALIEALSVPEAVLNLSGSKT